MASKIKSRWSAQEYQAGILAGDKVILSQAITLVESTLEKDRILAQEVLDRTIRYPTQSIRLGITGVPGVGKSTFIESLGQHIVNEQGKLAVLALDPTSKRSGGSIMGDKTRMPNLSRLNSVFIRPSPAGTASGGVGTVTREAIHLCEAAGFDTILVETVGVGQSETNVSTMVDFFMLLMLPGSGDDLQGIKRGIMEIADLIVITKADGPQKDLAAKAQADFNFALKLFPPTPAGWVPKAMTVSAMESRGIQEIWKTVQTFKQKMESSGFWQTNRQNQQLTWFQEVVRNSLVSSVLQNPDRADELQKLQRKVQEGALSPVGAARRFLTKSGY